MERKLYAIQEKHYAEEVLRRGMHPITTFCEAGSLAQNLVNTGLEDPAILEIDTEGISDIFRPAAHDEDEVKPYMSDFTNYYATAPIPAANISRAETTSTNELGARIQSGMLSMKENVKSLGEMEEVTAGMKKLAALGIDTKEHVDAEIQTAMVLACEGRFDELGDEETEEYYEEGSFRRPTQEEIENGMDIPEDDEFNMDPDEFTKAIDDLGGGSPPPPAALMR